MVEREMEKEFVFTELRKFFLAFTGKQWLQGIRWLVIELDNVLESFIRSLVVVLELGIMKIDISQVPACL